MLRIKIRPTAHPIVRLLVTGKSTDIRHFVKTTAQQNKWQRIFALLFFQLQFYRHELSDRHLQRYYQCTKTESDTVLSGRRVYLVSGSVCWLFPVFDFAENYGSAIPRSCIKISLRKCRLCSIDIRTVRTQTSLQALIFITS